MPKQNLKRNISIGFRVTREERDTISSLMAQAGIKSVRVFFFKMMADTMVVRIDLSEITALTKSLNAIGNNVNQLARRAHETGSIYAIDIEDIRARLDSIWETLDGLLKKFAKL